MGKIKVQKNVGGIEGLCVIEPKVFGDSRGYFVETYNKNDMLEEEMCIRDRTIYVENFVTTAKVLVEEGFLPVSQYSFAKKKKEENPENEAVSYTHLDVYKRQMLCHTEVLAGNSLRMP